MITEILTVPPKLRRRLEGNGARFAMLHLTLTAANSNHTTNRMSREEAQRAMHEVSERIRTAIARLRKMVGRSRRDRRLENVSRVTR